MVSLHTRDANTQIDIDSIEHTFAPASTAFLTRIRTCCKLCFILEVEHICPTAYIWNSVVRPKSFAEPRLSPHLTMMVSPPMMKDLAVCNKPMNTRDIFTTKVRFFWQLSGAICINLITCFLHCRGSSGALEVVNEGICMTRQSAFKSISRVIRFSTLLLQTITFP